VRLDGTVSIARGFRTPEWRALTALLDVRVIVEEVLGPADRAAVKRAVEREGERAFFRYWTRYEAAVKARGDGWRLPLQEVRDVAAGFDIHERDVPMGYGGAVAAGRPSFSVVGVPSNYHERSSIYRL